MPDNKNHKGNTPGLGVEILAATRDAGQADPVDREVAVAKLMNEIAQRAAEKALNGSPDSCRQSAKRSEWRAWAQWGATLLVLLGGIWWTASRLVTERPTTDTVESKIDKAISKRPQHPDSKMQIEELRKSVEVQQVQLGRIETGITNLTKSIDEIKTDRRRGR